MSFSTRPILTEYPVTQNGRRSLPAQACDLLAGKTVQVNTKQNHVSTVKKKQTKKKIQLSYRSYFRKGKYRSEAEVVVETGSWPLANSNRPLCIPAARFSRHVCWNKPVLVIRDESLLASAWEKREKVNFTTVTSWETTLRWATRRLQWLITPLKIIASLTAQVTRSHYRTFITQHDCGNSNTGGETPQTNQGNDVKPTSKKWQ